MRFPFYLPLLLVAGCSLVPIEKTCSTPPEEVFFLRAVDDFSATDKVELLEQIRKEYPDTAWAIRAETIIAYARELDTRKAQLAAETAEKQQLATDLDRIKRKNRQLEEKIGQLKKLLIELEQRPQ